MDLRKPVNSNYKKIDLLPKSCNRMVNTKAGPVIGFIRSRYSSENAAALDACQPLANLAPDLRRSTRHDSV